MESANEYCDDVVVDSWVDAADLAWPLAGTDAPAALASA
jgi:hypothetical protein